jgi:cytochrome c oxidase subunit 1
VTSLLVLIAFPILAGALLLLEADRALGAHIYDAANGGPIRWQHLFWFFGHPEVYIIALPFFGIVTEILPVFSRKPVFGHVGLVAATLSIGALSVTVWAHHMFVTGAVSLPFFSFMSFLIAVPTGVKFFNWIGTMWGGSLSFETPMLWTIGFLTTFLLGGLTGFYFWWPKFIGRMLDERLGKLHFWLLFIGFHTTFLVQHWLGVEGMVAEGGCRRSVGLGPLPGVGDQLAAAAAQLREAAADPIGVAGLRPPPPPRDR